MLDSCIGYSDYYTHVLCGDSIGFHLLYFKFFSKEMLWNLVYEIIYNVAKPNTWVNFLS